MAAPMDEGNMNEGRLPKTGGTENECTLNRLPRKQWRALKRKRKRQKVWSFTQSEKPNVAIDTSEGDGDGDGDGEAHANEETEEGKLLREFHHKQWVNREILAQTKWKAKKDREEKERLKREAEEQCIREEWETRQAKEKEEAEARKAQEAEKKAEQDKLLAEAQSTRKNELADHTGPAHNPVRPEYPEASQCHFYNKIGACRFGDRCSRIHVKPESSCTILVANMYNHFNLELVARDETDVSLEYDDSEFYQDFCGFYDDILPEFKSVGRVVQFKVCRNHEAHLRGNVYVQYKREREAHAAFVKFNGRWYGGRQLQCSFSPVTNWKSAVCGLFRFQRCPKGKNCNFLHVFTNPRGEYNSFYVEQSRRDFESSRRSHRGFSESGRRSNRSPGSSSWSPESTRSSYRRSPESSRRSHRRSPESSRRSHRESSQSSWRSHRRSPESSRSYRESSESSRRSHRESPESDRRSSRESRDSRSYRSRSRQRSGDREDSNGEGSKTSRQKDHHSNRTLACDESVGNESALSKSVHTNDSRSENNHSSINSSRSPSPINLKYHSRTSNKHRRKSRSTTKSRHQSRSKSRSPGQSDQFRSYSGKTIESKSPSKGSGSPSKGSESFTKRKHSKSYKHQSKSRKHKHRSQSPCDEQSTQSASSSRLEKQDNTQLNGSTKYHPGIEIPVIVTQNDVTNLYLEEFRYARTPSNCAGESPDRLIDFEVTEIIQ